MPVVAYFYFDFNDTEKQSSRKAIRSLILQAALRNTNHEQKLDALYRRCENGLLQPGGDTIRALLLSFLTNDERTFVILDAIDECTDREPFLAFLRDVMAANSRNLHIVTTSRREKDIEDQLGMVTDYDISIDGDVVDIDIYKYVRHRLGSDEKLNKWSPVLKDEITTILMRKAGGM